MDIDDYGKIFHSDYLTLTNIDAYSKCITIFHLKNLLIKKKKSIDNKKEFKLYRKNKKSSTNDIYASMNLISE